MCSAVPLRENYDACSAAPPCQSHQIHASMPIACCCFLGPPNWRDHKCCALNRTTSYEAPRTQSKRMLCSTPTRTAGHTQLSNDGFGSQLLDQRKKQARQLMPRRSRAIRHLATWCNGIQRLTKSHEAIGSVLCSTTAKAWVSVMSTGEKVLFSIQPCFFQPATLSVSTTPAG